MYSSLYNILLVSTLPIIIMFLTYIILYISFVEHINTVKIVKPCRRVIIYTARITCQRPSKTLRKQ